MTQLRALEPEDLEVLYAIENDTKDWFCSSATVPVSRYTLRQYLSNLKNDIFEDRQIRFGIDVDGRLAGLLDLTDFQPQHRRAEVGIIIAEGYRQSGVGKEALALLSEYARKLLGLHQIYAFVSDRNVAAKRLFETCGYQQTAVLKDWLHAYDGETTDALIYQQLLAV